MGLGISDSNYNIIKRERINGEALIEICENRLWSDIGIPYGDGLEIKRQVSKYLEGSQDAIATQAHSLDPNVNWARPRDFKATAEGIKYKKGSILPCERGPSILEWKTTEFKEMSGEKFQDIDEYEEPFIKRVLKFACACLNRRCNGTIYLGVGDDKKGKLNHGEVAGMRMVTLAHANKFQEWLEYHITGNAARRFHNLKKIPGSREMATTFAKCVGPIRAIEIEDSQNIVIEIDIEPLSSVCNYIEFYYVNFNNGKEKCYREGTQSISLGDITAWTDEIRVNANDRRKWDWEFGSRNDKEKLHKLLCRNRSEIDYEEFSYNLITNRPKTMLDIEWASKIRWKLVFDFDEKTQSSGGFYNNTQDKNEILG
jgi:hypothetical protein